MEHLASVTNQLLTAKAELEQELEQVNKMLSVVQPEEKQKRPPRGSAWDKNKEDEPSGNGTPQREKKDYPVSPEIVDDLYAIIQARKESGQSSIESIPGSVTAQELAAESKRGIGTVRKAVQQLEKDGRVTTRAMSWKDLGLTKPQATTKVIVAS